MRKSILILLALFFIGSNCIGQVEFRNWEKLQLKGTVRTLTEKFCVPPYKLQFEQQESIIRERTSIEVYQFNSRGDLVKCITSDPSQGFTWVQLFHYDDKNNLIEYFESDAGGEFYLKIFMRYDNNKNLIEKKECHQYGRVCDSFFYRYNKKNQLIEEAEFWNKPKPQWRTVYLYNDEVKIAKLVFNADADAPDSTAYFYDNKQNLLEAREYISDGDSAFTQRTVYGYKGKNISDIYAFYSDGSKKRIARNYDEHENLVEEILFGMDGKITTSKNIRYLYDTNGNWISRIEFREGELYTTIEREIEYY